MTGGADIPVCSFPLRRAAEEAFAHGGAEAAGEEVVRLERRPRAECPLRLPDAAEHLRMRERIAGGAFLKIERAAIGDPRGVDDSRAVTELAICERRLPDTLSS
jgi:hypothetical protein